jgi:hypothetical protein
MSAGFDIYGKVYWGTNGAVEAYVQALATRAANTLGPDNPLATFLHQEHQGFFPGKIVFLDDWVKDASARQVLLALFDEATRDLLERKAFTDLGERWIATEIRDLRADLAAIGSLNAG